MTGKPGFRWGQYNPEGDASGQLFNHLKERYKLKTENALSEFIDMTPGNVSKIRHGHYEVGAKCILYIHEKTDIPVKEIRRLINLMAGETSS